MKRIAGCLVLLAAARLVAAEDMVKLEPSPLELPVKIGPLLYTGTPHKYDQPGLGISYQYNAQGLSLTVYVYDADQKDIGDGADTMASCGEFEIARRGVEQSYQKVELKAQRLVRVGEGADAPLIREAVYEYEREQHQAISYIWITAAAGKFLKLRFSADPRLRDELPDARRTLLTDVANAVQPFLKPTPAADKKAKSSSSIHINGDAVDDAGAGFLYLGLLGAFVDKSPELAPVCGGTLVPDFETELSAWQGVLQMEEHKPSSHLTKVLAEANAAGFLDELVWVDMHRETWGTTPPDGVKLDAYAAWRKKHLKRFHPSEFGRLVFDSPRPLPIEPL
jgi:hypothetical protein